MTTTQKVLITVVLAAATGTGIFEARQTSKLRAQVQTLQQQASLVELNQLRAEKERAANSVQADVNELKQLRNERAELLRLRGQVGVMRQQLAEARQRVAERAADTNDLAKRWVVGEIKPKGEWQDAGLDSPLAAVETFWWAAAHNNAEKMKQLLVFDRRTNGEPVSDLYARGEAEYNFASVGSDGSPVEGVGLSITSLNRAQMPSDRAKIEVEVSKHLRKPDGTLLDITEPETFQLMRLNDEWKVIRDVERRRFSIADPDSETVAKMMMKMDPEALQNFISSPRLPARTRQAYEELKAKGTQ